MKYYAGIGSRDTPQEVIRLMEKVGAHLARNGWTLRSGGAQGSDQAFERGCDKLNGEKEIYLPWSRFENSHSTLIVKPGRAYEIAEEFHPYWHNLSQGARKLQARNSHQVLGQDLQTHSHMLICYTKNGKGSGGTGQALRIAKDNKIPIFDFGSYDDVESMKEEYRSFFKEI